MTAQTSDNHLPDAAESDDHLIRTLHEQFMNGEISQSCMAERLESRGLI